MNIVNRLLLTASVMLALPFAATAQSAAAYPTKPIHIVVPYSAGGVVDSLARLFGDRLAAKYGQPVVIDNRPGAGGAIGNDQVAKPHLTATRCFASARAWRCCRACRKAWAGTRRATSDRCTSSA